MGAVARLKEHPKGFWFVFAGELAERASYYGMRAILAMYIFDRLGYSRANASTIVEFFMAACYLLCLPGGWIADRFLGRYKTIVYFSFPYILGHIILGGFQTSPAMLVALFLLAVGSGTIKPSCSPLMGMIYEKEKKEHLLSEAFSYYYAAINIGSMLTIGTLPALRDHLAPPPPAEPLAADFATSGAFQSAHQLWQSAHPAALAAWKAALPHAYGVALIFPTVLMVVALGIFALGKKYYVVETLRTEKKTKEQRQDEWRSLLRVAPVFGLIVFFWFVYDQSASTWIFFARDHMNLTLLKVGSFTWSITPDGIQVVNPFAILALTPVFNWYWDRVKRKRGSDAPDTQKMVQGFFVVIACMAIMAVAGYTVAGGARITAWLEVIATIVISFAELSVSSIGLKFAFEQAAPGTKSFITSAFLVTVFLGDSLGGFFVQLYDRLSPGTYFLIQTGIMVVVALIFRVVARRFERANDRGATAAPAAAA
ncbi:MAG: peptide MFS transporter [Deltaproteobacteria bacterium]